MNSNHFTIRDYKPFDKNFIMASFLRGVYYGNKFYGMTPKDDFMNNYKHVGESLIANAKIRVACLPDDPDVILGYCITSSSDEIIHWCFVKTAWRRQGILKAMLPNTVTTNTHFTELSLTLRHKMKLTFNPFKQ